jgi:PAS domain S-box-containing protein
MPPRIQSDNKKKTFAKKVVLKKTNNTIASSESLKAKIWESFFRNSEKIIILVDTKANIIDINDVVKGIKKKELIGKSVFQLFDKTAIEKARKAINSVFKSGKLQRFEIAEQTIERSTSYYSCKATPHIENKKVIAAIVDITDITESVDLKNKLERSEQKFKKLSDLAFEGVAMHQNGVVVSVNKAILQTFLFSEKEIVGQPILKFVHPDFHKQVIENVKNNYEKPYQIIMLKKGKIPFWAEIIGNVSADHNGLPARATCIRDISQLKENEQKAIANERHFSKLIDNFAGITYRCKLDKNMTMLHLSNGVKNLTGYDANDIVYNKKITFNEIVHPEDRGNKNTKAALKKRKPFELEYRIITKNKEVKWVWEKGEGVFDNRNKLLYIEGFIANIDEKKKAEIELRKSRESYKNLIDNSPDGLLLYVDGKIAFANKKALQMLESKMEDIKKNHILFYLMPQYAKIANERMNMLQRGETVPYAEFKMKTAKGTIIEIESRPTKVVYDGKDAVLVVMHDLKDKKQLIQEQIRAQVAEQTATRLKKEIDLKEKAEAVLIQNEKYTRLLLDSSLDMICATDKNGIITEFNKSAEISFGYKRNEIIGKHIKTIYANPAESKYVTEGEIFKKGLFVGEVQNKRKNGELFTSYLSATVLKNESGLIVGAMGVSRDVTEIKQSQKKLIQSEEQYKDIFENANDLIQSVDASGRLVFVNNAWKKALGYHDNEIIGKSIFDFIHKNSVEHCQSLFSDIMQGKKIDYVEMGFQTKFGNALMCEGNISCKYENGQLISMRGIFRDVTYRIVIDKERMAQSSKIKAIFESSSHIIWTVDRQFVLTSCNGNFNYFMKNVHGTEIKIGMSMLERTNNDDPENDQFWTNKYNRTFQNLPQHFERRSVDLLGREHWQDVYLNPILDENNNVVEISGIAHDITEKKLASETISKSLREKETLLKEVHHRVKNNLQVISSILNLQSSYVKDEATLSILRESQNRIKSMASIHETLYQNKDFSGINFSDYAVSLVKNLIYSQTNINQKIIFNNKVETIFLNLDLAIPLGLILNEIVSNSIKYAFVKEKQGSGEINLEMKCKAERMMMIVSDNGVGLPEKIDLVNSDSLGLQLIITLIDQLNGTVEIERINGTKYTISFNTNLYKTRI